jgi:hypothetical protein
MPDVAESLSHYSDQWQLGSDGIWRDSAIDAVSYPAEGNEASFRLEEHSFWFRHRNKIIASLVRRFPPDDVFFDVGGGNGFVSKALQDEGIRTVLVEPGANGVTNARQRGVTTVVQSMWTPEIVRPQSAAAVGLFDVVEHIEDDLTFLKGVHQTLADDGLVFITVPAFRMLWSVVDDYSGHFRRYRVSDIQSVLKEAGFQIEYSTYFFCMLAGPIFLRRSIPSLIGMRSQANLETTGHEHANPTGLIGNLLSRMLDWEHHHIDRLGRVWTGSSCAIVARRSAVDTVHTIDRRN